MFAPLTCCISRSDLSGLDRLMELRVNIPLDSEQKEASDKGNKHTNNLYRAKIYKDLYGMLGRGARTGLE